jgi:hypothetical protein
VHERAHVVRPEGACGDRWFDECGEDELVETKRVTKVKVLFCHVIHQLRAPSITVNSLKHVVAKIKEQQRQQHLSTK